MKCYLVTGEYPNLPDGSSEPYTRFLRIHNCSEGPGLMVGERFLPTGTVLAEDFKKHCGEEGELHLPFAKFSDDDGPMRLVGMKRDERDADYLALVHIAVHCPRGGRMYLRSSTYDEKLVEHDRMGPRIEREYQSMEVNPGVSLVRDSEDNVIINEDHTEFLVMMYPGSSFRIHREPEERVDTPVLVVAWPGGRLRVFQPESVRKKSSRRRAYSRHPRRPSHPPAQA